MRIIFFSLLLIMSFRVFGSEDLLIFGHYHNPPWWDKDSESRLTGHIHEITEKLSKETKIKFKYVEYPYKRLVHELTRGTIDLIVESEYIL